MAKKNRSQSSSDKPLAMRIFILVVAAVMVLGVVASGVAALLV